MGIEYNNENKENENELNKNIISLENIKAPDFYINKNYPNKENKSIKELFESNINDKSDSFQNNNSNIKEDQKLLTPKFKTKKKSQYK